MLTGETSTFEARIFHSSKVFTFRVAKKHSKTCHLNNNSEIFSKDLHLSKTVLRATLSAYFPNKRSTKSADNQAGYGEISITFVYSANTKFTLHIRIF